MREPGEVTRLLQELTGGRPEAMDRLIPIVYDELRRIARVQLRREQPGHTLEATALVHEAWLRLVRIERVEWQDRAHFFAVAASSMRRILTDHARARLRDKRGAGARHVTLSAAADVAAGTPEDLVDLDAALTRLDAIDERKRKGVEYRVFGGLRNEEIAQVLGVSLATVKRDWEFSRAWLNRELTGTGGGVRG